MKIISNIYEGSESTGKEPTDKPKETLKYCIMCLKKKKKNLLFHHSSEDFIHMICNKCLGEESD